MLIADTGFFYALADRSDRWHACACEALAAIHEPLITTWPVLTETTHLMNARLAPNVATRFLHDVASGFSAVFHLETVLIERCAKLMKKYQSLPMDLADASLVLLAEHLDHGRILTTDERDCGSYRFKNTAPFKNELLSPT